MNLLEETIEDDLEHMKSTMDHDAKIGHKTKDTAFLDIKHISQWMIIVL